MSPVGGAGLYPVTPREAAPGAVWVVVRAPIGWADVAGLCARVRRAVRAGGRVHVVCDVAELRDVDAVAVDALARIHLDVCRLGCSIELRGATDELAALLAWMGLDCVLRGRPR